MHRMFGRHPILIPQTKIFLEKHQKFCKKLFHKDMYAYFTYMEIQEQVKAG